MKQNRCSVVYDAPAMAAPPLHGVRVLDCSRLLPGPFCSRLLADLGADVLRVDHPEPARGDMVRSLPPYAPVSVAATTATPSRWMSVALGDASTVFKHRRRTPSRPT